MEHYNDMNSDQLNRSLMLKPLRSEVEDMCSITELTSSDAQNSSKFEREEKVQNFQETLKDNANLLKDRMLVSDLLQGPTQSQISNNPQYSNVMAISSSKSSDQTDKHVQFVTPERDENCKKSVAGAANLDVANELGILSLPLSETVIRELCNMRNQMPMQSHHDNSKIFSYNQHLASQLEKQKQRTKDLEEELALSEAGYAKLTKELEIVKSRGLRKEQQLQETDAQVIKLQADLNTMQQTIIQNIDSLKKKHDLSSEKNARLESENIRLHEEIEILKKQAAEKSQINEELMLLKIKFDDILKENVRLNKEASQKDEIVELLQKDQLPKILEENREMKSKIQNLQEEFNDVGVAKCSLQYELSQLKDIHELVTQKAITEEELKIEALEEKENLEEKLKECQEKLVNLRNELHDFYQSELKKIIEQRNLELKKHIEGVEMSVEESLKSEKAVLIEKYTAEIELLKQSHARTIATLKTDRDKIVESLSKKILVLKKQRQEIVSAVSSAMSNENLETSVMDILQEIKPLNSNKNSFLESEVSKSSLLQMDLPQNLLLTQETNCDRKTSSKHQLITSTSLSSIYPSNSEEEEPVRLSNHRLQKPKKISQVLSDNLSCQNSPIKKKKKLKEANHFKPAHSTLKTDSTSRTMHKQDYKGLLEEIENEMGRLKKNALDVSRGSRKKKL